MSNIEKIKKILNDNNGIVFTSDLKRYDIARQYLKILENQGLIQKVSRGIYINSETFEDEFYCLQQRYKNAIFSHNTSLYFHELTDRTPLKIDITFSSNYRMRYNSKINVHYIKEELFNIGITEKKSPKGYVIKVYNLERTICDLLKSRNKIDSQIIINAIKKYVKRNDKNLSLLNKYSKIFKVEKLLKQYMEVLI